MAQAALKKFAGLVLAAAVLAPMAVSADEAAQIIEEVTVTGAVRGNGAVTVADIDLPGDEVLKEIPVAYE